MMPTFKISMTTTANWSGTVTADTEAEAMEIVEERAGSAELCIQCSGYVTSDYDPADEEGPWDMYLDQFDISTATVEKED
jgi:hypothetical protein